MSEELDEEDGDVQAHDPLTLSYIAVMCCGLAGALVLFLVFAVMPHVGMASLRGRSGRPSAGRDTVDSGSGARLQERVKEGVQDVASARLDLKISSGQLMSPNDVEWLGGGGTIVHAGWVDRYTTADGEHFVFYSPVSVRRRQTSDLRISVWNRSTSSMKIEGVLTIMAGGTSQREPFSLNIDRRGRYPLGKVNVDRLVWFEKSKP